MIYRMEKTVEKILVRKSHESFTHNWLKPERAFEKTEYINTLPHFLPVEADNITMKSVLNKLCEKVTEN